MTWLALRAFIATPLGRYLIIAALVVSAAFAAGWHERNVGWNERDVQAKQEIVSLNKSWVDAEAAAIGKAKADAKVKEIESKKLQDAIELKHKKDIAHVKDQAARDIESIRAGALQLRVSTSICNGSADVPGPPGGDASGASRGLPEPLTERLYGVANTANTLVADYNACKAIVEQDRALPTTKGVP